MKHIHLALAVAIALPLIAQGQSPQNVEAPVKELPSITIMGPRPTSLPTQIPTVIEGTTAEQIQLTTNAFDAGDALKYLPSLNVRKRYVADLNAKYWAFHPYPQRSYVAELKFDL